jgi:hypothetical protein
MTQITSSHADNNEKMKEGNCSIHIGIIVSNFLSFKCWTQIDVLSFGVSYFLKVPLFYTTLDFTIVWVFWIVEMQA